MPLVLLREAEGAVQHDRVILERNTDLNAFREDDLPLLQLEPHPLGDLQTGQLRVLGLDEVIQAPAELGVIEDVSRLRERLKDDVLIQTLQPRAERRVAVCGLCELPLAVEPDVRIVQARHSSTSPMIAGVRSP